MKLQPRDPHLDLLDEARHADAVAERAQRRALEDADGADATFSSSLDIVAETSSGVVLETTVGRSVPGVIENVTADHVMVADGPTTTWVRRDAITVIRPAASNALRASPAYRPSPTGAALRDVLAELALDRSDVEVHVEGRALVRGQVQAVGLDVLTVRCETSGADLLLQLPRAVLLLTRGA